MPTSSLFKDDAAEAAYEANMQKRDQELCKLYAPRAPMTQLSDEYRVSPSNLKPPLMHYGFPLDLEVLDELAEENDLVMKWPNMVFCNWPGYVEVVKRISARVGHPIILKRPFEPTRDCDLILSFYTNYSAENDRLGDEHEKKVLEYLHEIFGLEETVSPKWYFDLDDPWKPPEEDEDEGDEGDMVYEEYEEYEEEEEEE